MDYKQVIVLRTDIKMGKGKMAAQASHASLSAYLKTEAKHNDWVNQWLNQGQRKIVLKVESLNEMTSLFELVKKELPAALITDAGYTQIEPGTITALGVGPAPENIINKFFGNFKLL